MEFTSLRASERSFADGCMKGRNVNSNFKVSALDYVHLESFGLIINLTTF